MTIFLATFVVTLLARVPIGLCLMLSSFAYLVFAGDLVLGMMTQRLVAGADRFTLLAIPFFILAGKCMNAAGITDRIFGFARALVGRAPGGLGHANVVASIFFAGMSGSAVADAGGLGTIEIEAMRRDGYDAGFAAAVTAASSTIGPIIPPSIPVIVYAVFSGTSVAALFAGGLIPGLLMGFAMMILIHIIAVRRNYPRLDAFSFVTLWRSFVHAIPPLLTPVILVGGILGGVFTPTESGAVAALYAVVLGMFVYHTLTLRSLVDVILDTAYTTATVMIIVMAAALFGFVLTIEQLPLMASEYLMTVTENKWAILLIANILLFIVGCFLEPAAAMMILIPVFLPICQQYGIDLVHFGIMMVLNLMIGLLTPPVGLVLYVTSDIAKISFERMVQAVLPFFIPLVIVLLLITYIPEITLFLPRLLGLV